MISLGINIHPKNPTLTAKVGRIFKENDGFWYDPLLPYLYDTSTGVAQVDAAEDPIGLWIDRSKGAGLGAELVIPSNASLGTGWTRDGNTFTTDGTSATSSFVGVLTLNKWYEYSATISGGNMNLYLGSATFILNVTGTVRWRGMASGVNTNIQFQNATAGVKTISNISVKLLDGNHSLQATAAARLTYRLDSGLPYAAALGTDDSLTSATGGGGTVGFCYVAALKPTGGAGTLRTLWSDTGTNTGRKVQIDTNNKLSFSAGNGTAFTTLASTATLDVGTKYVVTVRDNGTNLSVKINTAAAETVARPVVAAGTAGFTQFKDNGAASSFLIADVYHVDGAGNSALTDSQVASLQAYARSRIGL